MSLVDKTDVEKLAAAMHFLTIGASFIEMYGRDVRKEIKDANPKAAAAIFQLTTAAENANERVFNAVKLEAEFAYEVTEDLIELIKVVSTKNKETRLKLIEKIKNDSI